MTLIELYDMVDGSIEYQRQLQEAEWDRIAWQTAHLLNIAGKSLKEDVDVDQLLGRDKKQERKAMTAEESKEQLTKLKEKFKA